MAGVNRVTLIGHLGKDPVVRFTEKGTAVANFDIACNETWKDRDGKKQERVEWVRIIVWDKLAEACGEYLKKGKPCYVEGRLQTRKYEKDGVTHWATEVVAHSVQFLGSGDGGDRRDEPPPPTDDDVPF
jgi:single-strand DNA-binding protein